MLIDITLKITPQMVTNAQEKFVAFYTGFIEKEGYGGHVYFTEHPQLSNELIDALLVY